jgi:CDI immunity proteins
MSGDRRHPSIGHTPDMDRPRRRHPPGVPMPSTIEEIERIGEPDAGPDATDLVRRCVVLRRKPLSQFTVEDLRIMLGQKIAVPILLPMAVAMLADDPLAEGDYYPGDLLYNVVRLPEEEWHGAPRLRDRLVEVLRTTPLPAEDVPAVVHRAVAEFLRGAGDRG